MIRRSLFAAVLIITTLPGTLATAAHSGAIIPQTTAARHGLVRPWFAQVQLDRGRGRLTDVLLYRGTIYAQTNKAIVQAIDAESGETIWVKRIGRPDHPSLTPGVARDMLAVVNGARLYVVNRHNGNLLYETAVKGAPGAGPALSDKRVYVPMLQGLMVAYRLESLTDPQKELGFGKSWEEMDEGERVAAEKERRDNLRLRQEFIAPLVSQSLGRVMIQPLVTLQNDDEEYCVWPTDRGLLNIGHINRHDEKKLEARHQIATDAGIAARPTYKAADPDGLGDEGIIYAASRDGFVHAIEEKSGNSLWRFSTGEPICEPAVVIADRVYVATRLGGMYCLDARVGKEMWQAPGVSQFVSASKRRVYTSDKAGRLVVLDAKSGARLDTLATESLPIKMINSQTDRIYLASDRGLIQCLHEIELPQPLDHVQWEKEQKGAAEKAENVNEKDPLGDGDNPFNDPFEM